MRLKFKKMRRAINFILICTLVFVFQLIFVESWPISLSCSVTSSCSATPIFSISSLTNGHAENWSFNFYRLPSFYPNVVCCQGTGFTVGNSCNNGVQVIKMSDDTNAHLEISNYTPSTYPKDVCMSPGLANAKILCNYTTQNCNDIEYDTCLATISSDTNAHVADCTTNPYTTKICCKARCKENWETDCTDGIDNDCNGLTDCEDPQCDGSINGTVKNTNEQPIPLTDISAKKNLTNIKSTTTDNQGIYNLSINCGTYNLLASSQEYVPQIKTGIYVPPRQQITVDFTLVFGTSCESDCTFTSDNIVHDSCSGKNGCAFCDNRTKAACDNSQPGWIRDYNESYYIICSSGCPQPKIKAQATVSCSGGTVVKANRILVYNGKPVRLVVATCG